MSEQIARVRPDIVHVHNTFPRLSPSIYTACRQAGVPVVQSLHNFRITCAAGTFVRDAKPCESCLHGSPYQAVLHRCYRNSALGSLAVAHMIQHHRRAQTYVHTVNVFIALTQFARGKFIEAGLPADRIIVKPNTTPDPGAPPLDQARHGALVVGRLSDEKGLSYLLEAWRSIDAPLRIVGTGPLLDSLRAAAPANVSFLGKLAPDAVRAQMKQSVFLIVPSVGYEGFPMVVVEAYACGLPVLASRLGGLIEIVEPNVTGHLFEVGDVASMVSVIKSTLAGPAHLVQLGVGARATYETKYSPAVVADQLQTIYRQLLSGELGRLAAE